jgi:plasmid stabilization system protein ParE
MAESKIIWSATALKDKIEILQYWIDRTKSITFSIKLDILIDKALQQISLYPDSGKKTDYKDIRIKIVRHYLIFYRTEKDSIQVIRIWDSRKDPLKLRI